MWLLRHWARTRAVQQAGNAAVRTQQTVDKAAVMV